MYYSIRMKLKWQHSDGLPQSPQRSEVIINQPAPLTDHNQENPYEVNPAVEMFCILAEQAH